MGLKEIGLSNLKNFTQDSILEKEGVAMLSMGWFGSSVA
jgi:hypothetical protein